MNWGGSAHRATGSPALIAHGTGMRSLRSRYGHAIAKVVEQQSDRPRLRSESHVRSLYGNTADLLVAHSLETTSVHVVSKFSASVRSHPAVGYFINGQLTYVLSAMVLPVQNVDGELFGVHLTFLAGDGNGKAAVEPARKIYGFEKRGRDKVATRWVSGWASLRASKLPWP